MIRLHDTMTRESVELEPVREGRVSIYSCGPTVYRNVHVGNLRTFLLPDLLRRTLMRRGLDVRHVQNITDVGHLQDEVGELGEDRMMVAAEVEGKPPLEVAAFYTEAWVRDSSLLNILPAHAYPKASEHVEEMVEKIALLMERGHAYDAGGNVYFDVASFPAYGRLSGNTLDALRAGHRMEVDPVKRHPADFLLWRAARGRRLLQWPSPWGDGFPGWHIECSVMSMRHLGDRFDVHTGGVDNIFPHHEDEIAQSEALAGHRVVSCWLHGEFLLTDGLKMAKSSGNVATISELSDEGFDPIAFRYLCLTARYRAKLNFTVDALRAAQHALDGLRRRVRQWRRDVGEPNGDRSDEERLNREFDQALDDDLDFPRALALVHGLERAPVSDAARARLITGWDSVLGLGLAGISEEEQGELPGGAAELLAEREAARAGRDFTRADQLRLRLAELGVEVVDTPEGSTWRRR
ncbi:MAG: cysteine--tRNA ligase [Candidatus Dormibacteria bacterium]